MPTINKFSQNHFNHMAEDVGVRRLGLDLGTNSIGWCLFDLNEAGEPTKIYRTGVRIFSDGRNPKSLQSLKATRREARLIRRRRDRFVQRQKYLIEELVRSGLMPADDAERQVLALRDPYAIRKNALDVAVDPFEMGRAIFHINQRRGYKSNRKSADNETGVVKQSIADFENRLSAAGARTIGEFLADRHTQKETVRTRRMGNNELYELYPARYMLEQEFDKLWAKQASFNPEFYHDTDRDRLKEIVFFQRKLKPQEVGRCTFLPEEDRIPKALPSFQRFRIYQDLSNLAWLDREGEAHRITESKLLRDRLFTELENKKKVTFKSMRAILKKAGIVDYPVDFNLEAENRDHLIGNLTSSIMRNAKDMMGATWDQLHEDQQDHLISLLLDDEKEDDEVRFILMDLYDLSADVAEACLDVRLSQGHGSLSKKAIDKILPILRDQGLRYDEAVRESGLGEANLYHAGAPLVDRLDYYGKVLAGHVMGAGKSDDNDEMRYGTISNPTVHIGLNQLRAVVNELIRLHGKPDEVVIEIGRDLPLGADGRRELQNIQQRGQDNNKRARDELAKHSVIDSRESRQKFLLWEQLGKDPTDRRCPFTGKMIALSDLFTDKIEIEHLLPFSKTFDDTMANKIVCYRQANRDKENMAPFDAFGTSPKGYVWTEILERSKKLPFSKQWRFMPDAMNKFDANGGFLGRQLNDMRYISRYTAEYIATIVPKNKIWVVTGRLTSLFRGFWGLNSILSGHNSDDGTPTKKSRDDHRHHAIDAIVVGMISRSMLQKVAHAARRSEDLNLSHLFEGRIDPWENFRNEVREHVDNIVVSHRTRKKDQGALHNDTAYGIVDYKETGASEVVHRVPITSFKKQSDLEKIRDPLIRAALLSETAGLSDVSFKQALQDWSQSNNVKSLRILEKISIIPVKDNQGVAYKAYKGDGNAYMDIYLDPLAGKWQGETVSRFDANQPGFIPYWQKQCPTAELVMRLRINDLLKIHSDGADMLLRVQKLSGSTIVMAPHTEANVDARHRDVDDAFKFLTKSPSTLQSALARKVHVSPTGLVSEAQ